MLAVGFIVASSILTKELARKWFDPNIGSAITLMAVVFGIAGSKMLYLFENWSDFVQAPFKMAFSPGGLTWYETLALLRRVIESRRVVGCDLVELCPMAGNVAPTFLCAKLSYKILSYRFAHEVAAK